MNIQLDFGRQSSHSRNMIVQDMNNFPVSDPIEDNLCVLHKLWENSLSQRHYFSDLVVTQKWLRSLLQTSFRPGGHVEVVIDFMISRTVINTFYYSSHYFVIPNSDHHGSILKSLCGIFCRQLSHWRHQAHTGIVRL